MKSAALLCYRLVWPYVLALLFFLTLFFVLRLVLGFQNYALMEMASPYEIVRSFLIGVRFDLRMSSYAVLPVIFIGVFNSRYYYWFCLAWLTTFAAVFLLLGMIEFEFYGEFQQRLNILVVQYLEEDPATVSGMIWNGFPVVRYLIIWLLFTGLSWFCCMKILPKAVSNRLRFTLPVVMLMLFSAVLFARGTIKSGPPLRWGDAYHSEIMFVNHLGLNGSFTFFKAIYDRDPEVQNSKWKESLPKQIALEVTRNLLVSGDERIIEGNGKSISRVKVGSSPEKKLNIVIILMESFSGQFVGALGNKSGVTPEFDRLTRGGLLLTRAFSNGTHTHQGTFATLGCFPNLPGHEYLMQQREGMNEFSGLTSLIPEYKSTFVYNGDFRWDNQNGFFKNQGMDTFIGRDDYVDPVISGGVWGVSDEDMFNRAEEELAKLSAAGNFVAYLQTLSNHIPYNIPEHDSFKPITGEGDLSDRLTAMKYSDWALGRFFRSIEKKPYYQNTIFVVLGDHGFGTASQLTEISLLRFHVPILFIAPGLEAGTSSRIASQLDVVPTILGLLGGSIRHQCWGRDLFSLPSDDKGFAIIKASGNEPSVAILRDRHILTFDHELGPHLYDLQMYPSPSTKLIQNSTVSLSLQRQLEAYVQTSLFSLKQNTTGP